MAKAEASAEEPVGMIERGELRLPEMQRRCVRCLTSVRDPLDSLYRGYPSGEILLRATDGGAWQAVSNARLHEYRQALPAAWADDVGVADETLDYIAQVRDNIDPALAEIARVLT